MPSFSNQRNTGAVFSAQYSPKISNRSKISFHFTSLSVVIVVVVVTDVVTVEVLAELSEELLPLTVTVVTVFPSSETIVFVPLNFLFSILYTSLDYLETNCFSVDKRTVILKIDRSRNR